MEAQENARIVSEEETAAWQKQLAEAKAQVEQFEKNLDEFLAKVGWTRESVLERALQREERKKQASLKAKQADCSETRPSTSIETSQYVPKEVPKPDPVVKIDELAEFIDKKRNQQKYIDMNKLKRDLKRRRVKYRTSTAPLTYTEELRELINLQMEYIKETERN